MSYYMTAKSNGTAGYWEPCKAKTLDAAKREATREIGNGFVDDTLLIATGDNEQVERVIVASKKTSGGKWINHDV